MRCTRFVCQIDLLDVCAEFREETGDEQPW